MKTRTIYLANRILAWQHGDGGVVITLGAYYTRPDAQIACYDDRQHFRQDAKVQALRVTGLRVSHETRAIELHDFAHEEQPS